jgi:hypothetical protein
LDEEFCAEFWIRNGNLNLTKYRTFILLSQRKPASSGHRTIAAVLRSTVKKTQFVTFLRRPTSALGVLINFVTKAKCPGGCVG